jgi:hypothetical protein
MSDAVVVREWAASMFAKNAPSIPKVEKRAFKKTHFSVTPIITLKVPPVCSQSNDGQ